ncbi:MAG: hypothetical protein LBK26_04495 [Rickettsiales bacterium]|jgi:hypothetical protein|nr:hypothetical protein [Rickettsiales bacterium]
MLDYSGKHIIYLGKEYRIKAEISYDFGKHRVLEAFLVSGVQQGAYILPNYFELSPDKKKLSIGGTISGAIIAENWNNFKVL